MGKADNPDEWNMNIEIKHLCVWHLVNDFQADVCLLRKQSFRHNLYRARVICFKTIVSQVYYTWQTQHFLNLINSIDTNAIV